MIDINEYIHNTINHCTKWNTKTNKIFIIPIDIARLMLLFI